MPGRESPVPAYVEFVPTPPSVVAKMLEVANVCERDLVYDLGCGDGRLLVEAARLYGARGVGFDIDPVRVAEARANVAEAGVESLVRIEEADLFGVDIQPATVLVLYLLPAVIKKLLPKLERLAPGSRIVSHDYDIEGVEYDDAWVMMAEHHRRHPKVRQHVVMLWTTPLDPRERNG